MADILLRDPDKLIAAAEGAVDPSDITESDVEELIEAGTLTITGLDAGNIKKGVTILGVVGTYEATQ